MIYGLGCRHIVADCFSNVIQRNINSMQNGDSGHGAEASGKGEFAPLNYIRVSVQHFKQPSKASSTFLKGETQIYFDFSYFWAKIECKWECKYLLNLLQQPFCFPKVAF